MTPRLKERYKKEIVQNLMSKLNYKNINAVPKIEKIVINMGLAQDGTDKKKMEVCIKDMSAITGQHPIITKFKKSISNFKSRQGANAGLKVTLRNDRMYEFLDRLVNIALPRVKDFRGLKDSACDKFGNFTFGIKEHIVFPEINFDKVDSIKGMDVTIVTTSHSKENTVSLLKEFNFPIVKDTEKRKKKVKKVFKTETKEEKTEK